MPFKRWLLALCAFFAVAVAIAGCGSSVPGGAVAEIAGNPISTPAFNHWMYVAAKAQTQSNPSAPLVVPTNPPEFKSCITEIRSGVPTLAKLKPKQLQATCKQLFGSLSTQVLGFLIPAYWYQAYAAREHVVVTNGQVQRAFDHSKTQAFGSDQARFKSYLAQSGQTVQDVLYKFRISLIEQKLVNKMVKPVSNAAIAAYYTSHSTEFGTPESRDLRIVLTKTKSSAEAARSALNSGQSWKSVAKKYSIDASTKNNGGLLTGVTQGEGNASLTSAAFSAPVGKLEGPVNSLFGYYVFEVTSITKPTHESLSKARSAISQSLNAQARQKAQTTIENRARKEFVGQTYCLSAYMMNDCSGYKPPKGAKG